MTTSIKTICVLCFIVIAFMSCNQGETLQSYFVANQERPSFIAVDVPISFLDLDNIELTQIQKEAYESIDKLNMLGYKLDNDNGDEYKAELEKVRRILRNEKYQELFRAGNNLDGKIVVKYIGEDTKIDELIVFGNMNDKGFAIIRVLGDDIEPSKIMTLREVVDQINIDEKGVETFVNFFK
ncbi:MAG: DUF4252 domain-containing protein [Flavobacteriaceae bacterium]|nr:DUF4252 domain-containing protein [Flavobacteriaceae bacterium]